MNTTFNYDTIKTFDERLKEATDMIKKFPNKIPILVEQTSKNQFQLNRNKFMCPSDINIGQFILVLRGRLGLGPTQNIFIFINGKTLSCNMQMCDVYRNYMDTDQFLKIKYNFESSFG